MPLGAHPFYHEVKGVFVVLKRKSIIFAAVFLLAAVLLAFLSPQDPRILRGEGRG